jgi:hypothetical protein
MLVSDFGFDRNDLMIYALFLAHVLSQVSVYRTCTTNNCDSPLSLTSTECAGHDTP